MCDIAIVRMLNGFSRYDLVSNFMKLRKQIFIDKMDWPLFSHDTIEFEQYDTFNAVYIIAHEGSRVLGGARLIRTDREIGTGKIRYSYMIRDAHRGLLPGMPDDMCFNIPPVDPRVWELTRLATAKGADVATDILHSVNKFLISEHAKTCLFLGPPSFMRMAKSMGYSPSKLGPIVRNDDGAFLAFSCDVVEFPAPPPINQEFSLAAAV